MKTRSDERAPLPRSLPPRGGRPADRDAGNPFVAVVDDDAEGAAIMAEFLALHNVDVRTFSRAEALWQYGTEFFSAIVLDIHLPTMWGTECAYWLRETGYTGPVIAITGNIEGWDEEDLHDLGFTHILGKPFAPAALIAAVLQRQSQPAPKASG